MIEIVPSILSADFARLAEDIARVERGGAKMLHLDVMDGHFVPNLTIGPPVVASLRRHTDLYFDCHLMITNPHDYLEAFRTAGADGCSVHVEVGGTQALIDQMRDLGLDVGLAVNPETRYEAFSGWLDQLDLILLMTVHPGFGGQSFMAEVVPKIARTRDEIDRRGLPVAIEVDGGIDVITAPIVAEAGATVFVSGSAIFGSPDPAAAAHAIRHAADRAARGSGPAEPAAAAATAERELGDS
jgi:ribulose-phosphate 3-epimerase